MARAEALKHNGASRIRLTERRQRPDGLAGRHLFPTAALACNAESGVVHQRRRAANDPEGASDSVRYFAAPSACPTVP
jgi:hypothetical protein